MISQGVNPSQKDPFKPELVSLLDIAYRGYQHAEAVVQARLYNFLFANSILLLSWAAVYAGNKSAYKCLVLFAFAFLSMFLGVSWSVMGWRHRKFLFVHTQIIEDTEAMVPETWQVYRRITLLQNGEEVTAGGRQ